MKKLLQIGWTIIKWALFAIGGLAVLGVLLIVAAALSGPRGHRIADKSVLVFDLNTQVMDRPVDESARALARLLGRGNPALQLRAATTALREAAQDGRISGLYLHGNLLAGNYSSGYGALKELRAAIQDFQKSGKPVIAYIANADNRDYYLESVADQILLNPFGLLAFRGLAAEGVFFKGVADKYGVEFTPIRHGKYKAAVEPLTREDFSPENREQIEAFLKVIWGDMLNTVAGTRKLAPDKLQGMVDKEGLISAESAKAGGLATELAYEGQALDKLRQLTGTTTKDKAFPQVSIAEYAREARKAADPGAVWQGQDCRRLCRRNDHRRRRRAGGGRAGGGQPVRANNSRAAAAQGCQGSRAACQQSRRQRPSFRGHIGRASPVQFRAAGHRFDGHGGGQRRVLHFHGGAPDRGRAKHHYGIDRGDWPDTQHAENRQ